MLRRTTCVVLILLTASNATQAALMTRTAKSQEDAVEEVHQIPILPAPATFHESNDPIDVDMLTPDSSNPDELMMDPTAPATNYTPGTISLDYDGGDHATATENKGVAESPSPTEANSEGTQSEPESGDDATQGGESNQYEQASVANEDTVEGIDRVDPTGVLKPDSELAEASTPIESAPVSNDSLSDENAALDEPSGEEQAVESDEEVATNEEPTEDSSAEAETEQDASTGELAEEDATEKKGAEEETAERDEEVDNSTQGEEEYTAENSAADEANDEVAEGGSEEEEPEEEQTVQAGDLDAAETNDKKPLEESFLMDPINNVSRGDVVDASTEISEEDPDVEETTKVPIETLAITSQNTPAKFTSLEGAVEIISEDQTAFQSPTTTAASASTSSYSGEAPGNSEDTNITEPDSGTSSLHTPIDLTTASATTSTQTSPATTQEAPASAPTALGLLVPVPSAPEPPTPAPTTQMPPTPAPTTSAPATPRPLTTSAPPTPIPTTPEPPAPTTPNPPTPAPTTPQQPTSAPIAAINNSFTATTSTVIATPAITFTAVSTSPATVTMIPSLTPVVTPVVQMPTRTAPLGPTPAPTQFTPASPAPTVPAPATPALTFTTTPSPSPLGTDLCPAGETSVSVLGRTGVFCVAADAPICNSTISNGLCPRPQPGLEEGSFCDRVSENVYGCRPRAHPTPATPASAAGGNLRSGSSDA